MDHVYENVPLYENLIPSPEYVGCSSLIYANLDFDDVKVSSSSFPRGSLSNSIEYASIDFNKTRALYLVMRVEPEEDEETIYENMDDFIDHPSINRAEVEGVRRLTLWQRIRGFFRRRRGKK